MVEIKEEKTTEVPVKVEADQEEPEGNEKNAENTENEPVVEEPPFNPDEYLEMKIKLLDDSEAFLFSYGPQCKESGGVRPLNCHLCRVGLKDNLKQGHLQSRLHQRNLKRKVKPERYRRAYRQFCGLSEEGKLMQFEIYPGENIPEVTEEYKDRVLTKEAQYGRPNLEDLKVLKDEKLHQYNEKMPLLGLGYIFKMKNGDQIMYHCALCDMKIKGEAYQHIAGATHQASYIIKHFPNLYTKVQESLKDIKNKVATEQCIRNIFRYLYRKIENRKHRVRVNMVDFDFFQKNREEMVNKCCAENHFDENSLKFAKKEIDTLIRKCLKGIEFIDPDLKSLAKPELGYRTMVPPIVANQGQQNRDEPPTKMRRQDFTDASPENWAAYRLMLGSILDEINSSYKLYENNPRSHPQYSYEWKLFWRQRCKELKRDKIDPRYHDFESEWAPYWIQRLRQFYAKDLANRKRELKRLLNLPFDRSPSPIRQMDQQMQPEPMQWQPQPQPPPLPMFGTPNMNQDRPMPIFTEDTPIISSEPLSVISVMRLLSALEDQLGSLGPKAVQLLSRAVLCEKDSGNTDELLLDNDYYVFFATVKEKFRGQLQANVIDPAKIKAVAHCVTEINSILDVMEKALAKERERQRREQEQQKRLQQQQQQQQQRLQQQQQRQQQQQQQRQQQQLQKSQPPSLLSSKFSDNMRDNTGRNQFGGNRSDSFGGNGGNFGGNDQAEGGNKANRNRSRGRKRSSTGANFDEGNVNRSGGETSRNVWIQGDEIGKNFDKFDNFGRNFSGGNDNSGRNYSGGNDSSGRNFSGGNDNSGRNFSGGNDNSGRNFGGGNDNFRRNFGDDNLGRSNFGEGNVSGRNFNTGGGNNSGRNFGGDNTGRNFGSSNFGGRDDGNNFGGGNMSNKFDNRNDNFNKGFDKSGRSNFGSGNDMGRNFGGDNKDNFGRNMGNGGNSGNFGRNFGGGNNSFNSSSGYLSGGGNNPGKNFGGNSNRGFGGNGPSRNLDNGGNQRDAGGNFNARRNDGNYGGSSGNFGGGGNSNPGGSFGLGQNNSFGRMMGFNSNY